MGLAAAKFEIVKQVPVNQIRLTGHNKEANAVW